MKSLKAIAKLFHDRCNEHENNYLVGRKTKKRKVKLRYNIEFELKWFIAMGHLNYGLTEDQVVMAIKKYRRRYEKTLMGNKAI